MPLECPAIQKNWRNYAHPASMYRSTHSFEYDGVNEWSAQYNLFGINTFRVSRINKASVSMWVKATGGPGFPNESIIVTRWFPFNSPLVINEGGWRIYLWDVPASTVGAMVVQFCTYLADGFWIYSTAAFPLNRWVHVCVTYDGYASASVAGLKLYWDGVLVPTTTILGNWTTNAINSNAYSHLLFGTSYTAFPPSGGPVWPPALTWWWEGQLDEVGLWYFELDQDEVTRLYNNGHPETPLHVGLPNKYTFQYYRMGERTDGTPWVFPNSGIIWGRPNVRQWPAGNGPNMFYNNLLPERRLVDVAP